MAEIHHLAPHHLPVYIPTAEGNDPLFMIVIAFMLLLFLGAGVLYFKLHSLPEQMGEKANSTQLQLISILAILALFTHNNAFWVLALLLAAIRLPDYLTPIQTIANSLVIIAKEKPEAKRSSPAPVSDIPDFPASPEDINEELPLDSNEDKERI